MDPARLSLLLERVRSGELGVAEALSDLRTLPFSNLGYARVDHHRALRLGVPEVILAEGKTVEHIIGVSEELLASGHDVLITRLAAEPARAVLEKVTRLEYVPIARIAKFRSTGGPARTQGFVAVVTAGTSDIPVAEEAAETLGMCGVPVERFYDVGVAGIHRLLAEVDRLSHAEAIVVVAGMEGALASVVGGLLAAPVIAVPTSTGYGVALSGLTALFGMLSSCASGVTVVNIDNGFGAAMAVVRHLSSRRAGGPSP